MANCCAVHFAVIILVLQAVVVYGATSQPNRFYASNSACRAKLPGMYCYTIQSTNIIHSDNAPISSMSALYTQDFLRQMNASGPGTMWINTNGVGTHHKYNFIWFTCFSFHSRCTMLQQIKRPQA